MNEDQDVKPDRIDTSKFVNTTGLSFPTSYMSASQVNTYMICPMSYYWRYVERKREPSVPKMLIGSVGHKVLEIMSDLDMSSLSEGEIKSTFDMCLEQEMDEVPLAEKGNLEFISEVTETRDGILPSLCLYYKKVFPTLKVLAQEVQVSAAVPINVIDLSKKGNIEHRTLGDMTFVGFIDFINYRGDLAGKALKKVKSVQFEELNLLKNYGSAPLEIGDYKTGQNKDEDYFRDDIQSPFYSYATGIGDIRIDNIPVSKVKFKKDGTPYATNVPPSYNVLRYQPQSHDIDNMLHQFSAAAVGIGSGSFPMCHPTSWKCSPKMCGHWSYCRGKQSASYAVKVSSEKFEDTTNIVKKKEIV
jgi:hypothetical protein